MKGPTPGEVLAAREAAGLTQDAAAKLLHLGNGRAWRQYESGGRAMSAAHWELFLIKTGVLIISFEPGSQTLTLAPASEVLLTQPYGPGLDKVIALLNELRAAAELSHGSRPEVM